MLLCFVCGDGYHSVESLGDHLLFRHQLTCMDTIYCRQPLCANAFDTILEFKRHLLKKHPVDVRLADLTIHRENELDNFGEAESVNSDLDDINDVDDMDVNNAQDVPPAVGDISLEEFTYAVSRGVQAYAAQLYCIPNLNRKNVDFVISHTSGLLGSGIVSALKSKVLNIIRTAENYIENYPEVVFQIRNMFDVLESPFMGFDTEYKRLQTLENNGHFIKPEPYEINREDEYVRDGSAVSLEHVPAVGQHVPLRKVLKSFLEQPNVFQSIFDYMNHLMSHEGMAVIRNFVQGNLWERQKEMFHGKIVFSLFLQFDDYEPNNSLGSHAGDHQLGALYATIPCIPDEFKASLDNMFLVALFLSKHRTEYGNTMVFKPVLEELEFLEQHGVSVQTPGGPVQVYFCLSLILADNLGNNSILGFVTSFRANFYCRVCKEHRDVTSYQCVAQQQMRRTVENYDIDVVTNDVSVTGIKERCIWNRLRSYHAVTNFLCDVMHDLFEGVLRYALCAILWYFIADRDYFSLETLHERIQGFDYGPAESGNIPPTSKITLDRLQNCSVLLSASEMLCLARYLGEMVGDLVEVGNRVWKYYLKVREIIEIVTAPFFQTGVDLLLRTLLQEHHEMYLSLFSVPLKPKHHFLLHYPELMRMCGPVVHLSSLMCERNHRRGKQYARVTNSRINLPYSVFVKMQLQLCERLMRNDGLKCYDAYGSTQLCALHTLSSYVHFHDILPFDGFDMVCVSQYVDVSGTHFGVGMVLVLAVDDAFPQFGKIAHILIIDRVFHFIVNVSSTVAYNEHVKAFQIKETRDWVYLSQKDLISCTPLWQRTGVGDGKLYVSVRYAL